MKERLYPCPVWQCSGELKIRKWKSNKKFESDDKDQLSWQQPDLVCNDCGSIYRHIGWKRSRKKQDR